MGNLVKTDAEGKISIVKYDNLGNIYGDSWQTRTADFYLVEVTLYQLS